MRRLFYLSLFILPTVLFGQKLSKENQIASAVMAATEEQREGATVLGYDDSGKLVTLKKGTNELICLADDPGKKGFSVACYHKDLEPLMKRGRELKAEGKNSGEIDQIRAGEVKA